MADESPHRPLPMPPSMLKIPGDGQLGRQSAYDVGGYNQPEKAAAEENETRPKVTVTPRPAGQEMFDSRIPRRNVLVVHLLHPRLPVVKSFTEILFSVKDDWCVRGCGTKESDSNDFVCPFNMSAGFPLSSA